ncbi:slit 1 protein [Caerostris extrusa]|uniref:Slit 1 protein n=1 Tax=Caerostris extrusa TaxID=172846 RepID=A0AAV4P531_CAEEX|nr:slit 1 protein [Caerostris extrusa]
MTMQKLRCSPRVITLLFYFVFLWSQAAGICPSRCVCNDEILRVICDSANLDVVPITLNPELRELRLSSNHIKALRSSLMVYRNLEFLDLSRNQLSILDKENFVALKQLRVLMVNSNMVSSIQNDTFKSLSKLRILHMNENYLQSLPPKGFHYLENLELLDLCQNSISDIDHEAFFGLKSLKTLLLRDNKITNIPTTPFQYVSKLFKLDLGLNSFERIPENSFSALNDLEELSLDGCGIKAMQYGALKWLNSLLILRIQDNELTEVPTKAFFDVIRLEEIHIGQNKFQTRLKRVHSSDNPNLKTITINHNKELKRIQDGAFDNLPNVQHVSLRGNSFETLHYNLLAWDELQFLDVRDNPFICNCSLHWLWKQLSTKNITIVDGQTDTTQVICVGPTSLKDRILGNLHFDDLDCYSYEYRRQLIIGLGSAAGAVVLIMIILGIIFRDKLADLLKSKWRSGGRKEPHYQKTSAEEESTILQAGQQSLKMIPVTEL